MIGAGMDKSKQSEIDNFLANKSIALIGYSRSGKKFGNTIYTELTKTGYRVYPIHNAADDINGVKCYKSFNDLPEKVENAIFVIPPEKNSAILEDARNSGVKYIWFQQGASDKRVIGFCHEHQIAAIHDYCILMFIVSSAFPHNLHKWFLRLFGKLPS